MMVSDTLISIFRILINIDKSRWKVYKRLNRIQKGLRGPPKGSFGARLDLDRAWRGLSCDGDVTKIPVCGGTVDHHPLTSSKKISPGPRSRAGFFLN